MGIERRRSERHPCAVPVDLHDRRGSRRTTTVDVSRHGLFVRTDELPPVRQLVKMTLGLPDGPLAVMATVARHVRHDDPQAARMGAGVGLQLFALARGDKDRWDAFVAALKRGISAGRSPGAPPPPVLEVAPPPPAPPTLPAIDPGEAPPDDFSAPTRMAPSARIATYYLRPEGEQHLAQLGRRALDEGTIVVASPEPEAIGTTLFVVVVHPTTAAELEVGGRIVGHAAAPLSGMIVHVEGTERLRAAFEAFVGTDDDEPTDPGLGQVAPVAAAQEEAGLDFDDGVLVGEALPEPAPGGFDLSGGLEIDDTPLPGAHVRPASAGPIRPPPKDEGPLELDLTGKASWKGKLADPQKPGAASPDPLVGVDGAPKGERAKMAPPEVARVSGARPAVPPEAGRVSGVRPAVAAPKPIAPPPEPPRVSGVRPAAAAPRPVAPPPEAPSVVPAVAAPKPVAPPAAAPRPIQPEPVAPPGAAPRPIHPEHVARPRGAPPPGGPPMLAPAAKVPVRSGETAAVPLVALEEVAELPPIAPIDVVSRPAKAAVVPAQPARRTCVVCGVDVPPASAFCPACGNRFTAASAGEPQPPPVARMVVIRPDGSQGSTFAIGAEAVCGRAAVDVRLDDLHVSPRHARFFVRAGRLHVEDLGSTNGTFRILREAAEVKVGDELRAGRQLLRLERLAGPQPGPDGTQLHGAVPRGGFRLAQLGPGGALLSATVLAAGTHVVGRAEGSMVFPNDGFMSGRHFELELRGESGLVRDLRSSNGTFLRLTAPLALSGGDYLLIGEQLLRVELTE